MAIPMLKIRRPLGRLILNMGIATPGKTVFLIEKAPRCCRKNSSQWQHSFQWKLHSHWLQFLRQCHVAVVRQGPVPQRDYIHGLVRDYSISSALAMDILQSKTKPSIWAVYSHISPHAGITPHTMVTFSSGDIEKHTSQIIWSSLQWHQR